MRIHIETNDPEFRAAVLEEVKGAVKSVTRSEWEAALKAASEDISRKILGNANLLESLERTVVGNVLGRISFQSIVERVVGEMRGAIHAKLDAEVERQFSKLAAQIAAHSLVRAGQAAVAAVSP